MSGYTFRQGNIVSSNGVNYEELSTNGKVLAEYVWIGGSLSDLRAKTKVIECIPTLESLPVWNYDGSSTDQAPGHDSEILIVPRRMYSDPFRGHPHIIVLCDTWLGNDPTKPANTNFREGCDSIMTLAKEHKPWFGIEQEYTLMDCSSIQPWPLGWPKGGFPSPQGPFYTGVGAEVSFGRAIANAHIKACLFAGVEMAGLNAEVMPGQWEFQVGPCEGIRMGDDL